MAIEDEIYMKYHVSQLRDLEDDVIKLWKKGQDRWCMRHHGMSSEDYYAGLDANLESGFNFDNDGVGGYGSSGRKPLPKEFHGERVVLGAPKEGSVTKEQVKEAVKQVKENKDD